MSNMKHIIIIYLISFTYLLSSPIEKQLVPPELAVKLLATIKGDAIVLGTGKIEVHTFIDPLCKMSQRYLSLLYKRNHKVFSQYTVYLYMHEIKSKKSKLHILNIIDSKFPEKMLGTIMLKKDMSGLESMYSGRARRTLDKIAKIANEIGVYKRPYIMINGKVK